MIRRWRSYGISGMALAGCGAMMLGFLLPGCGDDSGGAENQAGDSETAAQGPAIERKSELGPVTATIKVTPEAPMLGDPITLTLEVMAEPGVTVDMPTFGEALGRFQIVAYVPREEIRAGTWVATQTYTLQAPMSGKQRIPPLRVEFVDERPGQDKAGESQEILTDEIPIEIKSVLPEGAVAEELGQARPALGLRDRGWFWGHIRLWIAIFAGVVIMSVAGLLLWLARLRETQRQVSAYDVAMARLARLESRGLPEPGEADTWYVELSSIIRRYLEDRYRLRAPELTTEEFLQEARGSGYLSSKHRDLLSEFLMTCDRVKFARYEPRDDESSAALDAAREFLQDTRLQDTRLQDTGAPARRPAQPVRATGGDA